MLAESISLPYKFQKMRMPKILTFTAFLLFILITFSSSPTSGCNQQDKAALLAIKKSFPPSAFPSWGDASTPCCYWGYIRCDKHTGRVTNLIIHKNQNLKGSLPPAIGDLTALEVISFEELPNLVGPIPPSFSKLTKLQYLNVYVSGISGTIPSYLSTFTGLVELSFIRCKLVGSIPPSLGNLPYLRSVALYGNQLTGPIPGSLFSKLKGTLADLDLSENKLTGDIPRSLGKVQFANVNLANNRLTGDASFLFGKSNPCSQILLANNSLSFDLTNVEYGEKNLQFVDLSHNQIYGRISSKINNAKRLGYYDVSYNKLCGKIPPGKLSRPQFGQSSFAHNKCLCGKPLPPCKNMN